MSNTNNLNKIKPTIGAKLQQEDAKQTPLQWLKRCSAFNNRIQEFLIINKGDILDPVLFLEECKKLLIQKIPEHLYSTAKINFTLTAEYVLPIRSNVGPLLKYFLTRNFIINRGPDIDVYFDQIKSDILNKMEMEWETYEGVGWTLSRILNLSIQINEYSP